MALPGSILDNAQSAELRTYLAGQVARALAVFSIDEVVVFSDDKDQSKEGNSQLVNILKFLGKQTLESCSSQMQSSFSTTCIFAKSVFLTLYFTECPQYLRKDFFPLHKDLKYAGVLNPTDMPHHLRAFEESEYREGVIRKSEDNSSVAYIGLKKDCEVDQKLEVGLRVTVKVLSEGKKSIKGKVVKPSAPREISGQYWGYSVRTAETLSSVFTKSPFKGGYDLCIGTSERGQNIDDTNSLPSFKHLLIVFGGVKGLEAALKVDDNLDTEDPEPLFDLYLNTCPLQGSRTIRTEEAIIVTLSALRPKIWSS